MENSLTKGSVWKKLLLFAVPIFGANLLQALYGTVDLLIVGKFADAAAVSAVSTGSMTMQTLTGVAAGLTMGCTVLIGQNIGNEDYKSAARAVASGILLFVITGLITMGLVAGFAKPIAQVMNAPAEAFAPTVSYIRTCGLGILFIVLFNAFGGMFRGVGDSKTPLLLVGIAALCNIAGDYILVGLLGLGAFGAALATVAAQAVSTVLAIVILLRRGLGFPMEPGDLRPASFEIKKTLKYGLPIAAQDALTGISFMVILAILNNFGLIASAGVGIAEKICGLFFIVPGALMGALSAFSAQNIGAGREDRAKQGMYVSMILGLSVGLAVFAVSFFNGAWLAGFFSDDHAVCLAAGDYLRSYSIDCCIVSVNFAMMGYLNGCGRTGFVALQGILSTFLVRIPVSYFMSRIPGVSLFQVGFATPLATVFAIVITFVYMKRLAKAK